MTLDLKKLLHRAKPDFFVDTTNQQILHEILTDLGFQGKIPKRNIGGYTRNIPHEGECTNYQLQEQGHKIYNSKLEEVRFGKCHRLWNTCYKLRDSNCPVGEELARALLNKNLRIAVLDYDDGKFKILTKEDFQ